MESVRDLTRRIEMYIGGRRELVRGAFGFR
jgi:hypothetical protein